MSLADISLTLVEIFAIDSLKNRLRGAWNNITTSDPSGWSRIDKPKSWGQCAVTALVVQDVLGGEIIRIETHGYGSHYYNAIWVPIGNRFIYIDFTSDQFEVFSQVGGPEIRSRETLLENKDTKRRYEVLRKNMELFDD